MEKTVRPRPEHEEGGVNVYQIPPEYVMIFNASDLKQLRKDVAKDLGCEVFYHIDKINTEERCIFIQATDSYYEYSQAYDYIRGWFRGCFPI